MNTRVLKPGSVASADGAASFGLGRPRAAWNWRRAVLRVLRTTRLSDAVTLAGGMLCFEAGK